MFEGQLIEYKLLIDKVMCTVRINIALSYFTDNKQCKITFKVMCTICRLHLSEVAIDCR